jgi:drug/metabolite transporter (DMT)-like permease
MLKLSSTLALASALAYSTDVIFTKKALDKMPLYVFLMITCFIYFLIATFLLTWKGTEIKEYITDSANHASLRWALLGIIVGTMAADILMWSAIKYSSKHDLPLTSTLIHFAPVMSLLLVVFVYGVKLCWQSVVGLAIAVAGCGIMIMFSRYYD